MSGQWWTEQTERVDDEGETCWHRTRTCGVVWDEYRTHDEGGKRRYRAWVRVMQHDGDDVPDISLWMHNGNTPPPVLTVEECRTLGHALLGAAELVDRERDAAIRQVLEGGTR